MRGKRNDRVKKHISVDPDVLVYLDQLTDEVGMDRSWTFNALVREYRKHREQPSLDDRDSAQVSFDLATPDQKLRLDQRSHSESSVRGTRSRKPSPASAS